MGGQKCLTAAARDHVFALQGLRTLALILINKKKAFSLHVSLISGASTVHKCGMLTRSSARRTVDAPLINDMKVWHWLCKVLADKACLHLACIHMDTTGCTRFTGRLLAPSPGTRNASRAP